MQFTLTFVTNSSSSISSALQITVLCFQSLHFLYISIYILLKIKKCAAEATHKKRKLNCRQTININAVLEQNDIIEPAFFTNCRLLLYSNIKMLIIWLLNCSIILIIRQELSLDKKRHKNIWEARESLPYKITPCAAPDNSEFRILNSALKKDCRSSP